MVPEDCQDIESVEEFLEKLKSHDPHFKSLVEEAKEKEETLRFMAVLENGKAEVGLKSVDKSIHFILWKEVTI